MANALYPLWKQALMTETDQDKGLDRPDAVNAPYVAVLNLGGLTGYAYNDAHQFFTDLIGVQGAPQQITNPSVTTGLFKGDSVVFVNITGAEIRGIVIYRANTLPNNTWRLALYEDAGIIGFPITPNGGNLIITWNVQGIFQL